MVDIKNILSKPKLSRTDISQVYKKIKELKLNIPVRSIQEGN